MKETSTREYPIKNSLTYPSGRVEIAWARSENTQQKILARVREMRKGGMEISIKSQNFQQYTAEEIELKKLKEGQNG